MFGPDLAGILYLSTWIEKLLTIVTSIDPNDKFGSSGASQGRFIRGASPLSYTIAFENLASASAPAQAVVISDELDIQSLDPRTLTLGLVRFGNRAVEALLRPNEFNSSVSEFKGDDDLRPHKDLIVRIEVDLQNDTGQVSWRLTALDPSTHEPPEDPLIGFLPPNRNPPEGEGSVTFAVWPRADIKTGTQICNTAQIVFDANDPITACAPGQKNVPECPGWCNTIDADPPASSVVAVLVDGTCPPEIDLSWSGEDQAVGAGVRDFDLFVSVDGGEVVRILQNTLDTSSVYQASPGHSYAFYTRSHDNVGNYEDAPTEPDAIVITRIPADLTNDETVDVADWAALLQCAGQA